MVEEERSEAEDPDLVPPTSLPALVGGGPVSDPSYPMQNLHEKWLALLAAGS